MGVTEGTLADIDAIRDELLQINQVIALTERTAEQAEDDFAWRLSLKGFYGLRSQRLDELESATKTDDESVQRAAIRALGKAGGEAAIGTLREALQSDSGNVRKEAVWALCDVGTQEVAAPLAEALGADDVAIRALAAQALGRVGGDAAIGPLAKALRDEEPLVRGAAAEALRFLATPEALRALTDAPPLAPAGSAVGSGG